MHEAAKRHLVEQLAEGGRRAAKSLDCPRCGAPVLRGDDHDEVAMVVTVDAAVLDPADEMLAILDGRHTYDLTRLRGKTNPPGSYGLWHREPWHLDSAKPPAGTVHRTHRCSTSERSTLF